MGRLQRLTKTADFAVARREGASWSNGTLVVIARANGLDATRIGFSVGKRVGKAVVRNKIKRSLREIARHSPVEEGWDLVVIARKGSCSADFATLTRALAALLKRARVLEASSEQTSLPERAV